FPLTLGGGSGAGLVTLDLVGGFVTAKLTPSGGSFKLTDGTLVGRWPTAKLLNSLSALQYPPGTYICPGSDTYKGVKPRICRAADVSADLKAPASSGCTAISLAILFTAEPARFGPVIMLPEGPPHCDAGATIDDCP